jgi:hypothetical protein
VKIRNKNPDSSCDRREGPSLLLYSPDEFLDGIDLFLFKGGLALPANPCRNGIECDMPTPTVSMKRSMASFHFALAMDAFRFATLASPLIAFFATRPVVAVLLQISACLCN